MQRIHTPPFESTLKVRLPKDPGISASVNVCLFVLVCGYVSCACSTWSPGTSVVPPVSQFLTSRLENMLIQTNPLFLLLLCSPTPGINWKCRPPSPAAVVLIFLIFYLFVTVLTLFSTNWLPSETKKRHVHKKLHFGVVFLRELCVNA